MSQNIVVTDLDRLRHSCSASQSDASPFRTAVRNIVAASNSPVGLASYCREGVVVVVAGTLAQARAPRGAAALALPAARREPNLRRSPPARRRRLRRPPRRATHALTRRPSSSARRCARRPSSARMCSRWCSR